MRCRSVELLCSVWPMSAAMPAMCANNEDLSWLGLGALHASSSQSRPATCQAQLLYLGLGLVTQISCTAHCIDSPALAACWLCGGWKPHAGAQQQSNISSPWQVAHSIDSWQGVYADSPMRNGRLSTVGEGGTVTLNSWLHAK